MALVVPGSRDVGAGLHAPGIDGVEQLAQRHRGQPPLQQCIKRVAVGPDPRAFPRQIRHRSFQMARQHSCLLIDGALESGHVGVRAGVMDT
jgi:hypothetical protein